MNREPDHGGTRLVRSLVRNHLRPFGLAGDTTSLPVTAMHRDLDALTDPVFWVAMTIGILPLAMAGTALVWVTP